MATKRERIATVIAAILAVGLTGWMVMRVLGPGGVASRDARPESGNAPAGSPAQTQPEFVGPRIKVGVMLSHFTATGPSWIGSPYGYGAQTRIIGELHDPAIELYPVIEPETQQIGELPGLLQRHFGQTPPISVADAVQLRTLDVLVTSCYGNVHSDALDAVESAVKDGMGLLVRQSFGTVTPEYTPQVCRINGLIEGQYGWNPHPVECEIVGDHPLLGKFAGKMGTTLMMMPNGAYGLTTGTPLIRVKDGSQVHAVGSHVVKREDYVFYPLFLSQLGKGRIVRCSFAGYQKVPMELQWATGSKFTVRCVKWLAGKPLD